MSNYNCNVSCRHCYSNTLTTGCISWCVTYQVCSRCATYIGHFGIDLWWRRWRKY